jgi:hypothetical protein
MSKAFQKKKSNNIETAHYNDNKLDLVGSKTLLSA